MLAKLSKLSDLTLCECWKSSSWSLSLHWELQAKNFQKFIFFKKNAFYKVNSFKFCVPICRLLPCTLIIF